MLQVPAEAGGGDADEAVATAGEEDEEDPLDANLSYEVCLQLPLLLGSEAWPVSKPQPINHRPQNAGRTLGCSLTSTKHLSAWPHSRNLRQLLQ